MNLENLRTATRAEHEGTESGMPLMDDSLTSEQYADVLQRLYVVVRSWERWALANAPEDLAATVEGRQRSGLIEKDLLCLGFSPGGRSLEFPANKIPGLHVGKATFRSSFLGAMYVMEGSTLGGQYIAKHLEKTFQFTTGEGNAYFRGYGEHTGEMWNAFKTILIKVPEDESAEVIAAAKAMFGVFGDGMNVSWNT